MTQPIMSKHCRKIGSKDKASIPSGPLHHSCNNTTTMQYEKKHTKYTDININESTESKMGPVSQNPIQRTVRTAHLSVLMTVHNFTEQF